jgi:hypothetical protein
MIVEPNGTGCGLGRASVIGGLFVVNLLLQPKELRYFRLNLCRREVVELDVLFYAPFCVYRSIKLALPTLPPAE